MNEPRIPGGAIILARKIIDSEIMDKPPLYMKVWVYLLGRAQHKQYKQLERGQLRTTIDEIREACSWHVGARKETPTIKEVRCVLDWMRGKSNSSRKSAEGRTKGTPNGTMISTTKGTHGMVVTIENYSVYQDLSNYEGHKKKEDEGHAENPTKGIARAQYKQECFKNEQEIKKIDDDVITEIDHSYQEVQNLYLQKAEKLILSGNDMASMSALIEKNIPLPTILEGIEQAFKNFKPKHPRDKIHSFSYCLSAIESLHHKNQQQQKWNELKKQKPPKGNSFIPESIRKAQEEQKQNQQTEVEDQMSPEEYEAFLKEFAEFNRQADERMKAYENY